MSAFFFFFFPSNQGNNYLVNQLEPLKNIGSMREMGGTWNLISSPTDVTAFSKPDFKLKLHKPFASVRQAASSANASECFFLLYHR